MDGTMPDVATGERERDVGGGDGGESFEDFRRSFSYGSRTDLDFKFLTSLPDDEATEFLRVLLDRLGEAYDTGDLQPLIDAAIDAQIAGYAPRAGAASSPHTYDEGPFAPTSMPVAGSTIGLLASSGHFVEGDDPRPFGVDDMSQAEAVARIDDFLKDTPILSEIPVDVEAARLRVRHGGYDITSALRDRNVALPIDRLRDAEADGRIGRLSPVAFSFPGATAQGRLRSELPSWIDRIDDDHVDAMLLVPL
jgi:hypothetical protein